MGSDNPLCPRLAFAGRRPNAKRFRHVPTTLRRTHGVFVMRARSISPRTIASLFLFTLGVTAWLSAPSEAKDKEDKRKPGLLELYEKLKPDMPRKDVEALLG